MEKANISEKQYSYYLLFPESCLFRVATFSKDVTFYSILFRRAFFNILLQKSYYFTATFPFHSYTSYLLVIIKFLTFVIDSRKIEGYVYLRKTIYHLKVSIYSTEIIFLFHLFIPQNINFCLKSTV